MRKSLRSHSSASRLSVVLRRSWICDVKSPSAQRRRRFQCLEIVNGVNDVETQNVFVGFSTFFSVDDMSVSQTF